MSEPWERFTDSATIAIHYAREEAIKQQVSVVGTEHLLAGLLREKVGVAAHILKQFGVTLERMRNELDRQPLPLESARKNLVDLTLSHIGKEVLRNAWERPPGLRTRYGHPNAVATEHLLLGLLIAGRQGNFGKLLKRMDVNPESIQQETLRILGALTEDPGNAGNLPKPMPGRILPEPAWRKINEVMAALFPRFRTIPVAAAPELGSGNAYDYFLAAGKMLERRDVVAQLYEQAPEEQSAENTAVLEQNAGVLAKVREGFVYAAQHPPVTGLHAFSHLGEFRDIARLFVLESRRKVVQGDFFAAAQSCIDGIRFSILLSHSSVMIVHLVAITCERIVQRELWRTVAHLDTVHTWQILQALTAIERQRVPLAEVLAAEAALCQLILDAVFTDVDAFLQQLPETASDIEGYRELAALSGPEQEAMKQQIRRFYDTARAQSADPCPRTPRRHPGTSDPRCRELIDKLAATVHKVKRNDIEARLYAAFTFLLVTLHAYGLEHSSRPKRLANLVPDYLPRVPIDPFTRRRPIGYQHDNGKECFLYSIGPDGNSPPEYRFSITSTRATASPDES